MIEIKRAMSLIAENGFGGRKPLGNHFVFKQGNSVVTLVRIDLIAPPQRSGATPLFGVDRGISLLKGFFDNEPIPPIRIIELKESIGAYRYSLYNGFHRFYLSQAVGYELIPAEVFPEFE
jgi:hypothetical protein